MPYFQINEENFTFVSFKTDDSIKWKLMYSIISFWGEILLFKPNKGHQINNQCERLTFFSSPVFKKTRYNNNAYKNISSALCPHSLLVVSIISDGSQELVAISLTISGSWAPDATYVQDRSQLFFFFFYRRVWSNEATDQTRPEVQVSRGEIGLSSWDCITSVCKTLISLFLTSKPIFLCQRDNFILQFLSIWEPVFFSRACWSSWSSSSVPGLRGEGGVRAHPSYPPPYGPDILTELLITAKYAKHILKKSLAIVFKEPTVGSERPERTSREKELSWENAQ